MQMPLIAENRATAATTPVMIQPAVDAPAYSSAIATTNMEMAISCAKRTGRDGSSSAGRAGTSVNR